MAYKISEWCGGGGDIWYTAPISEPANSIKKKWWYPARMMNMELTDYINLIKEYGGTNFKYYAPTDVLYFCFKSYREAHSFVLYINRLARNSNW